MNEMRLEIAGESLELHAERAAYWRHAKCLLVADVHFGKGAVLRRAGITVPTGQTLADLGRLDDLIAHYQPAQLIVLGDLVHGTAPRDAPWIGQVSAWRQRHADVDMRLIAGNHDRHFDTRRLGFEMVGDALAMPPFLLRHEPGAVAGSYVLAGHVHPGTTLRDGWRRHRVPAFRFADDAGLLPSFGTLTGLHETPVQPGERIVAVTPGGLLPLGAASRRE
ncbi:ligase-associated DNA damage response endonuclease PdeM [Rhodanobacter sp. AS-Z3]|uniref:ligase-associated DNA damage response endonuclease PdeM n=1 Tax=Rhodanobacter sp. AS-Z3 TaxID=3031330 RepID=UPI002478CFDE|nr:ligase-associated DNA damage response endonuclease PdeM [Rhodanobacter sp. AS-Z3]WEN13972.1 ligase-associated DNA damage response endonuclease PdeM [Rhodanobacter sp. AS-Z3]